MNDRVSVTSDRAIPQPATPQDGDRLTWDAVLSQSDQPGIVEFMTGENQSNNETGEAGRYGSHVSPAARAALDMLGGTVTNAQVLCALQQTMSEKDAKKALGQAIKIRHQFGQEFRKVIAQSSDLNTPISARDVDGLTRLLSLGQPKDGANSAVRSLLREDMTGRLNVTPDGRTALDRLYQNYGYAPERPNAADANRGALPTNMTEANRTAARLLARASSHWHRDAGVSPVNAKVPVAVVDGGFETSYALLAPKINNVLCDPDLAPDADHPTTHPPASACDHGTFVATLTAGGTHVVDVLPLRFRNNEGSDFRLDRLIALATPRAKIVNLSIAAGMEETLDSKELIRESKNVLFAVAAGNYPPDRQRSRSHLVEQNLQLSRLPNTIITGYLNSQGDPKVNKYVYHSTLVDTTARGEYALPRADAEVKSGTSFSAPTLVNIAAIATALAPHLPMPEIKRLVESTTTSTPAWEDGGGSALAKNPPLDGDRALSLAAVAGLVVSGDPDVRQRGARDAPPFQRGIVEQSSALDQKALQPGMTPEQAADALKLKGSQREQALRDHEHHERFMQGFR